MSSPIAKIKKGFFDKILISIHKKTSHSKRVDLLSTLFAEVIKSVNPENKKLRLLDVGCGQVVSQLLGETSGARCHASVLGGSRRSGSPRAAHHESARPPRSAGQSPPRTQVHRRPAGIYRRQQLFPRSVCYGW